MAGRNASLLGFTKNETRILLFLISGFLIGLGVWMFRSHWAPLPVIAVEETGSNNSKEGGEDQRSSDPAEANSTVIKRITLNTANQAELESIPGVGPVTARRIIDFREKNGRFQSIEELMEIKGIGQKTIQKIERYFILK
jgi:comEA protein